MLSHTILIVDDEPTNLAVLMHVLKPHYRVRAVNSGSRCLAAVRSPMKPDLILLDVMMPEMDGYEVLARLRTDPATSDIPVLFVTALDDDLNEEIALARGAADYLTKPIRPGVLLARVRAQIEAKHGRDFLLHQNVQLDAEVARRMRENEITELVSIRALAHLAETRDPETGNHILRTQGYVHQLADALRKHPRFSEVLTPRYVDLLTKSAPLHDIGKVGVPDAILLKPGPLTPQEWAVMKTHAEMGAKAIDRAEADIKTTVDFLVLAKEIAHWHHEKWDGSGYPDGLAAHAIPLSARLMALADVFDALISVRVYKSAMPYEKARDVILAGQGRHFDPDVVDAFLASYPEFVSIAERHSDPTSSVP